jgi:acetyltransferase
MREFFYPVSVAVIGVSAKPTNLGRNIVGNLVEYGFNGIVYAVGPGGGMIETRRIYRSVGDIPDQVDLAVILTPAKTVPGILEECGQKGIRRVIVETAGFREYGEDGRQLEDEMTMIAEKHGIRFVGPNCVGAINMENGFCVPFPRLRKFIKQGGVSIITQSGGVGMSALNLMANEGLGLNKFVSVGNMLNVNAEDVLEYLITDKGTNLIFLYLESIRDGRRLMDIARGSPKPILAFKSNIGKLGQDIALSHTASLTSDDKVVEAAFHQSGIIRVRDATSLGNSLKILELPPMKGKNLAVISRSGGHAVMAADACELSGFDLALLPDSFLREIEKHFRASVINLTNPLDLGDLFDLDVYAQIIEETLKLESVDAVVFLHTSLSESENQKSRALLDQLVDMVEQYDKPVAYYIATAAQEVSYLKQNYNFPIFTRVVETIRALETSYQHCSQSQRVHMGEEIPTFEVSKPAASSLIHQAKAVGRDLSLSESLEILERYGIPTVRSVVAMTVEEAQQAAQEMGYPVAIKIVAGQIGGMELILGGRQDPQFGPVILVGLGGIFVEIFEEAVVRVAPISRPEAQEMIESLRGVQILKGARGHKPADIEAVVEALMRLSQLMTDFPEIKELDINPLRVFHEQGGVRALDARVILE